MTRGHRRNYTTLTDTTQLRSGSGIQEPVQVYDVNRLEMASPFDGVAALFAAMPDQAEARFNWLLSLDRDEIASLLAACAGGLIETCGQPAADNCAKLKRADLALACAARIPNRGWLPPALLTPERGAQTGHDDVKGYVEYDPDAEFAIAAE